MAKPNLVAELTLTVVEETMALLERIERIQRDMGTISVLECSPDAIIVVKVDEPLSDTQRLKAEHYVRRGTGCKNVLVLTKDIDLRVIEPCPPDPSGSAPFPAVPPQQMPADVSGTEARAE